MPKLKPSAQEKRGRIIGAWQRYYNLSDERAAAMLGVSKTTLKRRMKVGDWSIDELHRAIRGFHIPPFEAMELLTVGCIPMENYLEREKRKLTANRYPDESYHFVVTVANKEDIQSIFDDGKVIICAPSK